MSFSNCSVSVVSGAVSVSSGVVSVSGNVAQLVSGWNKVQIASGFNQVLISGQPVSISGNIVSVSGNSIGVTSFPVSGSNYVLIANQIGVPQFNSNGEGKTDAFPFIFNPVSQSWDPLTVPISGVFAVQTSLVDISGNPSYNTVYTGGSGIFVPTDGQGSTNSGGVALASCGPIINATLRSYSGNGPMRIGGIAVNNAPLSGRGIELFTQETLTLQVTNTNQIAVWNASGFSGQAVSVITTAGT